MVQKEYAKALYELALNENNINLISDSLKLASDSLNDEDFLKVMSSSFINAIEKKNIIKNVFKGFNETFVSFLYVLVDNNRFHYLNEIYEEFEKLLLSDNNICKVEVLSSIKLNKSQLEEIKKSLQIKYNDKKIQLENIVDEGLIGGIKITSNGEVIDLSVKGSLNKLKESL